MKVLLPIIYHDLTRCIARAFENAGHEVMVVDWRRHSKEANRHKVEPMCIDAARKFRPDFCFAQFQSSGLITDRFPKLLQDLGCFSVNWSGDVRHPLPDWYKQVAPFFSVTAFTNTTDVEEIRALGYRSEFLQIGLDMDLYTDAGAGERSGVVFIGNNYGGYKFAESGTRRDMVDAMCTQFGDDFKVYGVSWEHTGKNNGGYVREPADAHILRKALVAVGMDHFFRPGFASDRLLRATACGCATVNYHYDGIEKEHPHVGDAYSIPDMVRMVRYALNNPELALAVGKDAAKWTREHHTWDERVKQMMTWM